MNKQDRELLEHAAKAIDLDYDESASIPHPVSGAFFGLWKTFEGEPPEHARRYWNPLTDDGDALRLAADLGLAVVPYPIYARPKHSVIAKRYEKSQAVYRGEVKQVEVIEVYGEDAARSTRRAIVRAAAEIGREADIAENADYLAA